MKIALISLARRGGMVHFHGELVNAMSKNADLVSITAKHASAYQYSIDMQQLTIDTGHGAFGTFFYAANPLTWLEIIKVMWSSHADLFHLTVSQEWNPIVGFFAKILGKPLVFSMHDPEHHIGAPIYMRISDMLTARMSDAIVVLSKLGKKQLVNKGFRGDRIYHIPQGLYSFSHNRTKYIEKEKMILFFGRIEPYKGLDILLKSFSQSGDQLIGWKLVIAGGGSLSAYSTYLGNASIEIINRFIDDAEVAELMQKSSFVVAPYIEATQSGVIQVAYAFARPVIATDVGSLSEMVIHEKTGLLIKPNNVEELTKAINILSSDSELCERMGNYAYEVSQMEWNWEKISKLHMDMYDRVLSKYNKRAGCSNTRI